MLPALFFAAACSPRTMAIRMAAPVLEEGALAFHEEPDPALAREAFASQLKLLEGLLKSDPGNARFERLLAEGFGAYAFLFLEDSEPERAKGAYLRGRDHALASLPAGLSGLPARTLDQTKAAVRAAGPGDVASLFWAGYGWGGWINLSKDNPQAVADLPKVVAVMERVQELSPGFYFGGPDLFLGSYHALRPRMLGGDPNRAKAHFESAERGAAASFLLAKVLHAQYYAVAVQDQELFTKLLNDVLEASADVPRARLANAVAKQKAKRLLEKANDLF